MPGNQLASSAGAAARTGSTDRAGSPTPACPAQLACDDRAGGISRHIELGKGRKMPHHMYVALQGDDAILRFAMDPETGKIESRAVLRPTASMEIAVR